MKYPNVWLLNDPFQKHFYFLLDPTDCKFLRKKIRFYFFYDLPYMQKNVTYKLKSSYKKND